LEATQLFISLYKNISYFNPKQNKALEIFWNTFISIGKITVFNWENHPSDRNEVGTKYPCRLKAHLTML
jgi:hypothetical protein